MPIEAECDECGRVYRLAEEMGGRRIRCKDCGEVVNVPRGRRSGGHGGRRPGSGSRSPGPRGDRPSGLGANKVPVIVGSVVLGVAAVIGIIVLSSGGDDDTGKTGTGGGGSSSVAGTPVADTNRDRDTDDPPPRDPARDAAHQANIERARQQQNLDAGQRLVKQYGADKVCTVTFTNVVGDTKQAERYLRRRVFRAAYKDYADERSRASQQERANAERAKEKAVAEHKKTWGQFGPGFVRYQYETVESTLPYPQIIGGKQSGNEYTYHVVPALNPRQFADRIALGAPAVSGRTITVDPHLPTPIPDPDVEELVIKYADRVAHVTVTGAEGIPDRVRLYIEDQIRGLAKKGERISIVAMKSSGGRYEFSAAPIDDLQDMADRLPWATVSSISGRRVTLAATVPADLPSKQEVAEAKAAAAAKEKAVRDADRKQMPRPGESEIDWALREIQDGGWGKGKALRALATMKVDPDRLDEVSRLLILTVSETRELQAHLDAMLNWKTDRTEATILSLGGDRRLGRDGKTMMGALVKLNSDKSAQALASAVTDFFNGADSVRYLIEMGPIAEPYVLIHLQNNDAKIRTRAYSILSKIGTSKSLSAMRKNARLEKGTMKILCEQSMEEIRERRDAEKGDTKDEGDGTS